jgi:hypothetical protein
LQTRREKNAATLKLGAAYRIAGPIKRTSCKQMEFIDFIVRSD